MRMGQFVTEKVNTLAMMTATDSTRSTSTRWKEFGHFFAVGFVHTEAFHRRNCRCIWRFFEFVHNARKRGTAFFETLVKTLLKPSTRNRG